MPSKKIQIPSPAFRFDWRLRIIIILDDLRFDFLKSERRHVESMDFTELGMLEHFVPHGELRCAVMRESVCPPLFFCEVVKADARNSLHAELLRSDETSVTFDDEVFRSPNSDRVVEFKIVD